MGHAQIYEEFKKRFALLLGEKEPITFFPNGKDSIRITQKHKSYIFTYRGIDSWSLETTTSWINRTRKEKI